MPGPLKYDWYDTIQKCAALIRGGICTITELSKALEMPRRTLTDGLRRELGIDSNDTSPTRRKYRRYGNSLIGFAHGKDERKRIEKLMQIEAAGDWGETRYREFHLGDLHHEEAREDGGIIFRRISAITATDAWHAEMGYVGPLRRAQAFVWSKTDGLETIINVGVAK